MSKTITVGFDSPEIADRMLGIFRDHGTTSGPEISVSCFDERGQPSRLIVTREGPRSLGFRSVAE